MVVTGYYNKGYESVIADYTVSPAKFETLGTNTVTVSYQGMSDSFEVNVVRNDLESITIKNPPNKIAYKSGEKLTLTGMVVEANYKDGTVETITGYTTTPVEGTRLKTTNKKVIISYQNKTTEQSIVVVETPEPTPTPTPTTTYTITYNGNENTSGTPPAAQSGLTIGSNVTLAAKPDALVRENYVFAGWNTKNDGTGTSYATGSTVPGGFAGNVTLYANWIAETKLNRIGGKIFFIVGDDNGATYRFFKQDGTEVTTITVAGLADAYYYTRVPENGGDSFVDKFYVADSTNGIKKYDGTNYCVWATDGENLSSASGIEVLGTWTASKIGAGKKNTAWIFANRNNVTYFPNGTQVVVSDEPIYAYSCWDFCKACNEYEDPETKKIVGVNGCTDWFVPSIAECEALYKSGIWGALNTWVDTTKYDSNTNSALWSSSAGSGTDLAWYWGVYASGSNAGTDKRNNRNNDRFLAVVRAF